MWPINFDPWNENVVWHRAGIFARSCQIGLVWVKYWSVCENVAVPSGGSDGLCGGVRWVPPPPATRWTAWCDGLTGPGVRAQPSPEPCLHAFLVRTDKPGYLSAATSIQPIASRTWARFIFSIFLILSYLISFRFDSLLVSFNCQQGAKSFY